MNNWLFPWSSDKTEYKLARYLVAIILRLVIYGAGLAFVGFWGCKEYSYSQASKLYQAGNYVEAKAAFNELNGFRNSDSLAQSCEDHIEYQQFEAYLSARNYDDAMSIADEWLKADKSGAENMCLSIVSDRSKVAIETKKYGRAFSTISHYVDEGIDVTSYYEQLVKSIANNIENIYYAGDFENAIYSVSKAKECADKIQSGMNTKVYDEVYPYYYLASARKENHVAEEIIDFLLNHIGFADVSDILVLNTEVALEYLSGDWESENNKYYFSFDHNGHMSYLYPSVDSAGSYYIENGEMFFLNDADNSSVKAYTFEIIDKDTVEIYSCGKALINKFIRQ